MAFLPRPIILVVEPDDARRELLRRWLALAGYVVLAGADGRTALAWVHTQPIDLLLVASQLPDMAAAAFVAAYRQLPGPHAPVVAVGAAPEGEEVRALQAAAVLPEPVEADALLAVVRRFAPPAAA